MKLTHYLALTSPLFHREPILSYKNGAPFDPNLRYTLKEKGEDALTGNTVKRAAMERVFGFEILPAPFVVSHLQLGLLLQNLGAPLSETGSERAGVYLTNALSGWEPPSDEVKKRLQPLAFSFAELRSEHDAAERVKREAPILSVSDPCLCKKEPPVVLNARNLVFL